MLITLPNNDIFVIIYENADTLIILKGYGK